jgi:preprotein translocase subunit SecA
MSTRSWLAWLGGGGSVPWVYGRSLRHIRAIEAELRSQPEGSLRSRCLALRYRATTGEPLERLLPETYALVCAAAGRTIGLAPFDAQVLGGIVLCDGGLAEMETGEGKTLTAILPLSLHALAGRGTHLVTANDYLARRDSEWMRPVFECLGFTVAAVESSTPMAARRQAYSCDVTYGTAREFGFDFLRDLLRLHAAGVAGRRQPLAQADDDSGPDRPTVQRDLHFALVDEGDSILLDEARTPLLIRSPSGEATATDRTLFEWCAQCAAQFRYGRHVEEDVGRGRACLTPAGRELVRCLPKPVELDALRLPSLYEAVERAIHVARTYARGREYVVRDEKVVIVDEFTGRTADGRQWRDGVHQAVEAGERLPISPLAAQSARITVQDYFRQYRKLASMTGTARPARREFRAVYGLSVVPIPTHRPVRRVLWPTRVFVTRRDKWAAVVRETVELHAQGRPVLIGTRSIDKSEQLSALLSSAGVEPAVLNADRVAAEAQIIAQAGRRGQVTVATNMAGRGTDIRLAPDAAALGGLHVIGTEMHDSSRVDRQLIGRCGRQGDPGSFRQFLSLDDEILDAGLGPTSTVRLRTRLAGRGELSKSFASLFRAAQRRIERRHRRERRRLQQAETQQQRFHADLGYDYHLEAFE